MKYQKSGKKFNNQIIKKGDISDCKNWRGVTLLSVPSKIVSRIILNHIKDSVESQLGKNQAGFRKHRSSVDLIPLESSLNRL